MPVAAVTGLAAEARIAREVGLRALASGGNAARTAAAISRLIGEGATGLISFGICGGLDPRLASGTMVLPLATRSEGGARRCVNEAWHASLADVLPSAATGELFGSRAIVDTRARKAALFRESGAIAVDLESHLVAQAALAAGIPFVVLRVVADAAGRGLPAAALVGLDAAGEPALGVVLGSIARHPKQVPALLRVTLDTHRALRALRRAARLARAQLGAAPL
jgi:adenosylhomocysteine nucleosidase